MGYRLQIQKIRLDIDENYDNLVYCIELLKQAIQIADAHNDLEWGVDLRLDLIHFEDTTCSCRESLPAFAWVLDVYDRYPDRFDEADILEEYDMMFCAIGSNGYVTKEQLNAIREDLYQRLERTQSSKRGYYFTLSEYFENGGDFIRGEEYTQLAMQEPFNEEDSEIMENIFYMETLLLHKRFDEAIVLLTKSEHMKEDNTYVLFQSYCAFAYNLDQAKDSRAQIYLNKAKEAYAYIGSLRSRTIFCLSRLMYLLYKYEDDLQWEVFERIAEWELNARENLRLMFLKHAAIICAKGGTRILDLPSTLPYFEISGVYDLDTLYTYFDCEATKSCLHFDKHYENDFCSNEYMTLKLENGLKV